MRIAVTGAAGFVGRHLCRRLERDGHSVVPVTRASADLSEVTSPSLERLFLGSELVMHLAGRAHVLRESSEHSLGEFLRANVEGSTRVAAAASRVGVRRLVFLSSILVHGSDSGPRAFRETDTAAPRGPYAISKWRAEQILTELCRNCQLELTILRPPLVYGPGVKGNFRRLVKLSQSGLPLPLASIRNLRSLIFVDNLTDAVLACATHRRATDQTFLVSDGQDVSTPELIRRLSTAMGRSARLVSLPLSLLRFTARALGQADVMGRLTGSLQADSSHIRETIGWVPPHSMEDGIKSTADWYRAVIT
jgi:nucleoside-diphosphate-sugar epimerase